MIKIKHFKFLLIFLIGFWQQILKAQPCNSNFTSVSFEWISNVTFGPINNTTAGVTGGPVNFTSQVAPVIMGLSYPLSVTINADPFGGEYIYAFIDWNQNNVLNDAGEVYIVVSSTALNGPHTITIPVPVTATAGNCRMRVMLDFGGSTVPDPCKSATWGEAEDYTVNVIPNTPCSGQPTAGVTVASATTPCPGTTVNFSLSGSTIASGLSYQWLRANVSTGPWVTLPGANSSTYSAIPVGSKCYRCIVTCLSNGLFDTSAVVCVTPTPWSATGTCWCVPTYTFGALNDAITNFSLDILNNNTSAAGNPSPFWVDYTSQQLNASLSIPNLYIGLGTTAFVTYGSDANQYGAIWVDFNHNGAFDATEYFSNNLNAGSLGVGTITITPPAGAVPGITRLRVRGGDNAQMLNSQACGNTNSTTGESEDYLVNIIPSSPKDPAVSAISVPNVNCFTANETVDVTLRNYGNTNINLLLDSVKVTLKVNGPSGLVNYTKTVNTGSLFTYGSNSINVSFTNVNLFAGGNYSFNTSLAFAPPGGGASNTVTINDSLFVPITRINYRPTPGPDFNVCQNSPILFGQGVSVSGCATPINDSVEIVFNVTPCIDNVGATTTTTSQTVPGAACANEFACNFGNGIRPAIPAGASFSQNAKLTITNLQSGYNTEVRFNLYSGAPVPPTLFAPCTQGYQGPIGNQLLAGLSVPTTPNTPFTNFREVSPTQLASMFNTVPVGGTINIGYFESYNDLQNAADATANNGGTTTAKLKIYYTYVPGKVKWYDNNTSTTILDTFSLFNPLSPTVVNPSTQMTNTANPGTYTFFATCDGAVDCRVPVNIIVAPIPIAYQDTMSFCENAVGSNQAIFDLTTMVSAVSGGLAPPLQVDFYGDQGLFGPIATPTMDTSSTNFVYSKVFDPTTQCYASDSLLLQVNSIPEFVPNVISNGTVCAPASVDVANLIGAFSTVPANADTSYYEDAACTIPLVQNPHQVTMADTVYIVIKTNTIPVCSDTAVAYIDITQAANKIANQVTPGNYSDCLTPINCGNVTLTDGGVETLYTNPSCLKVANVTDAVNGIDLGSTQICETIDCTTQTHNGQPYVNRVYQITPTTNDSGTVCLYYLDDDFDQYNAYASANGWPLLPLSGGPANLGNIAISRVENGPLTTLGSYIGATIPNNLITSSFDPSTSVWTICFPTDSFSHFYVHSLNPNNVPLPVTLVFNGKRVEGSSVLNWVTMMENNNSHFVVERSKDGKTFSKISDKISSKAAQGNSQSQLDYAYTDAMPMNGHNYYRLEQNDLDGHQSYSKVVDVYFGNETVVTMYPNPVRTLLHIDINTPKATLARARIIDAAGRVVRKVDMQLQAGNNESEIDMQGLADGVYQIQISNDKGLNYTQTIRKN